MVRRLVLSLLVLFALVSAPIPRVPARAASLTPVSFALNWITNVEFAGIWAAQHEGWWTQAGLSVTVRGYDFSNDPIVLVGAGKYQFGFQDGASLVIARANGHIPLQAVWASGQKSPFAFITLPKSGITSVKDFKGKRIGYQAHELYVLKSMLNQVGMSLSDVKPVVVEFDPTVLLAGRVDAYLAYLTNEPIEMAQKYHVNVNIIRASDYGYNFYSDVLFTTNGLIKSNPGLVAKVVAVMDRGWKYALAHPSQLAKWVVPALDKNDTISQQEAEMTALRQLASAPGAPTGTMTTDRWQAGINLLVKYGQIKKPFPASDVFTDQFLPKQ